MRAKGLVLVLFLFACRASATVENTMPVASLQSFRTASVRVHTNAFAAQGNAAMLENQVLAGLQQKCGFEQVSGGGAAADIVLDLNITNMSRGGGLISNENVANIETLLVLTDGQGDLLGTAKIKGKSSGMVVNNARPEDGAIEVVAKSVVDLLAKSGCVGPRVAKAEPPPPPPDPGTGSGSATDPGTGSGSATPAGPDESKRAEAEALNQQGKEKLYGADSRGAAAAFQQANALLPDAKYAFNLCLALGAAEDWDNATAACNQAKSMSPKPQLLAKIDTQLERLAKRQ